MSTLEGVHSSDGRETKQYLLLQDMVAKCRPSEGDSKSCLLSRRKECRVLKGSVWQEIEGQRLQPISSSSSTKGINRSTSKQCKLFVESMDVEDLTLKCKSDKLAEISPDICSLLLAIPTSEKRYYIHSDADRMFKAKFIHVGSDVIVSKRNMVPCQAMVKWKGLLAGRQGLWFGIEIMDEQSRGSGDCDGFIHGTRLFHCEKNNGMVVNIAQITLVFPKKPKRQTKKIVPFTMGVSGDSRQHSKDLSTKTELKLANTGNLHSEETLQVGDRVLWPTDDGNEEATVRWIGSLSDEESLGGEILAGVEFDNPIGRGTGQYKKHRLFHCKKGHACLVQLDALIRQSPASTSPRNLLDRNTEHLRFRSKQDKPPMLASARKTLELSYCLERVFFVTLDKGKSDLRSHDVRRPSSAIFLQEIFQNLNSKNWLEVEDMSQVLLVRMFMSEDQLKQSVVRFHPQWCMDTYAKECRVLTYLSQCYVRAHSEPYQVIIDKCKRIIVENASTCLRQPDLYNGQDIQSQLIELMFFKAESEDVMLFLEETCANIVEAESLLTLSSILHPLFRKMHDACTKGLLGKLCSDTDSLTSLKLLHFFARNQNLAEVLLAYTNTTSPSATAFEKTLFGTILSSSCAPSHNLPASDTNDLFNNPLMMSQTDMERAFTNSAHITSCMSDLFLKLCRLSLRTRHLLLLWIGRLLNANSGRVKLACTMSTDGNIPRDECSDGLMLNLCSVLAKLCKPFSEPNSHKLLKIQPQYCRQQFSEFNDQQKKHHHAYGLPEETFLIQLDTDEMNSLEMPTEYSFICDLFFLTHQALYLGLHATHERFLNRQRELSRIMLIYQESQANNSPIIKRILEDAMRRYLGIRVALVDPELLKPILQFHVATSTYLTYIAAGGDNSTPLPPLTFPLHKCNNQLLACIPEHIITNLTDVMFITRRFKQSYFQEVMVDVAGHFMDLILVFMGSKSRLKNPHLRAKLAEVVYEMMPTQDERASAMSLPHPQEKLYKEHMNVDRLAEVLLDVFVSIETTGESVEFEQKLCYRQPMYKVLHYIWTIGLHQKAIVQLSDAALVDIENTDPPLFLKFVNLLVNDSNFLLDEALDYMKQIREKESERDNWTTPLQGQELQQFESNLSQMNMLARFHNSAAVNTTHTLSLLTSSCSRLFCHSIMVDRICAMLNYFLLKLTGPQMKEFKVKDFDKCEFKPSVIVSDICQIYLNLSHSDQFCQAVSADGRSYSAQLFPQAERVLIKIHKPAHVIQRFKKLAAKIQNAAAHQTEDDELVSSAPEEFLDAIMGTLMKDPVILPSSKQVVDRPTIARHILSDQSDPFNRSALALDQVIPNEELKTRILSWIAEQIKNKLKS